MSQTLSISDRFSSVLRKLGGVVSLPAARRLVFVYLTVLIGAWTVTITFSLYDSASTKAAARAKSEMLGQSFAIHTKSMLEMIDHVLIGAGELYLEYGREANFLRLLEDFYSIKRSVVQIGVVDPAGYLVASNLSSGPEPIFLGDREHIKDAKGNEMYVSLPVIGRLSGKETIQFARKIMDKDNHHVGTVVVSVEVGGFSEFIRRVDVGRHGSLTLLRDDLSILTRAGAQQNEERHSNFAFGRFSRTFAQTTQANFIETSPTDGVQRFYAMSTLAPYPVVTLVGLAVDEELADFRLRQQIILIGMAIFTLLVFLNLHRVLTTIAEENALKRELESSNRNLSDSLNQLEQAKLALERQGEELAESMDKQYFIMEELRQEVARRTATEEQMRHMAQHDALTGLPNRRLFIELAGNALAMARRNNYSFAVLNIDIDGFKSINDTMGHDEGDELLRQIAVRYSKRLRDSDVVARIGGDEFAALLPNISSSRDAEAAAIDLVALTSAPFALKTGEGRVGASVGVALFPRDGETLDQLMHSADEAMYKAKKSGKNQFRFASPIQELG